MGKSATILVDFDGTVVPQVSGGYSTLDIGSERVLKELIQRGHKIHLWTCRNNSKNNPYNYINGKWRDETSLDEAIRWFTDRGIQLAGVNMVPGGVDRIGHSRKILGDIIIDDSALGTKLIYSRVPVVSYLTGKKHIIPSFYVDWDWVEECLKIKGIL